MSKKGVRRPPEECEAVCVMSIEQEAMILFKMRSHSPHRATRPAVHSTPISRCTPKTHPQAHTTAVDRTCTVPCPSRLVRSCPRFPRASPDPLATRPAYALSAAVTLRPRQGFADRPSRCRCSPPSDTGDTRAGARTTPAGTPGARGTCSRTWRSVAA